MGFREISAKEIKDNAIKLISDEWMLISVGDEEKHNMMTASWGFLGEMWGKDCAICAIRPTRHTYSLIETSETFALVFMGEGHSSHKICGSKSGRDIDKIKATGLTPVYSDGTVYYEQANTVVICRKMYAADLDPAAFTDKEALDSYGGTNYHRVYVGEIVKVLTK